MPTISKEDYLKEIYKYQDKFDSFATTTYLANKLSVSKSAVTDMAKSLSNLGLVAYTPYKGIKLKAKGRGVALKTLRRHRLWELFLMSTLNIPWENVHAEAELLEHSTSEYLIDRIDEKLGTPNYDPHGEPIPTKEGKIPKLPKLVELGNAKVGMEYKFVKVNEDSIELLKYLSSIELTLYTKVKVIEKIAFDNSVIIDIDGVKHSISEKISANIDLTLVQ